MRLFYFFIFLFLTFWTPCFSKGFVDIDLNKGEIRFENFHFGKYNIVADLFFDVKAKDSSLILNLEGSNILLKPRQPQDCAWMSKRNFSWIKLRMLLKDNTLFINYLYSPEFLIRGKIDLATYNFVLDFDGRWQEKSVFLEGDVKTSLRLYGKVKDYMVNGMFDVRNGIYRDVEFSKFSSHFLGKPPLFYVTDSEVTLKDGGVYKIEGAMDIRDLANLFPKAEFISRQVAIDGWKLLSERERNVGLKKNVDDNLDVVFDTYDREEELMKAGTEVRYKVKKDQFLRLRMQEDKTIVGFEKRKEF
jgi:hypothetical protein